MKTTKEWEVGARPVACNILEVERCAGAPGWD